MMKPAILFLAFASLMVAAISGCGLVSGTVFVSERLTDPGDSIVTDTRPGGSRDGSGRSLDTRIEGVVVDLSDNSDYNDIDVDGVEDCCIRATGINHLATPVSGEVWITLDVNVPGDVASIQANGFRIFHGMALGPNETHIFTCAETLSLLENIDQLNEAIQVGKFKAWGLGDQDIYCFSLTEVFIGMHLTGSI